ncbi:hypothetical protein NIES267_69550 [Calothrix parasitica NIES-267]|uniref:Uncharacterized protein n=1 Tax=Calothrix parasitica NIES-267 TaxID=1973488 RepID=A0A1Z4M1S6_9CYAN|nr:hypothetical protein NIES267_69550 [Calothrix parasitica NIES-267]
MLGMALIMLTISTFITDLPYLVLGLSFVVGASASILVRETIVPTPQTRVTKIAALLLLGVSVYIFTGLFKYVD